MKGIKPKDKKKNSFKNFQVLLWMSRRFCYAHNVYEYEQCRVKVSGILENTITVANNNKFQFRFDIFEVKLNRIQFAKSGNPSNIGSSFAKSQRRKKTHIKLRDYFTRKQINCFLIIFFATIRVAWITLLIYWPNAAGQSRVVKTGTTWDVLQDSRSRSGLSASNIVT